MRWRQWWRHDDACHADVYEYASDGGGRRDDVFVSGDGDFIGYERDYV